MTSRLTLVCHAPTTAVRASAFPADEPVEFGGMRGLTTLPHRFGDADRRWTSPALRARQTARALDLDAVVDPLLRDCAYGRWTGCVLADVQAREPEAVDAWLHDPASAPHGGESVLDLIDRIAAWLDGQNGTARRTVAVTHASVMRAAVVHALDASPRSFRRIDVAPLSVVTLSGNGGRWTLTSLGAIGPRA